MTSIRFVYITASNSDEARNIGKELVAKRLAACVNIIDKIHSIYWWEGKVHEEQEVVMIAKTKESLVQTLIEKVTSLHSYACPCIVSLPIVRGHDPFLEWVAKETR